MTSSWSRAAAGTKPRPLFHASARARVWECVRHADRIIAPAAWTRNVADSGIISTGNGWGTRKSVPECRRTPGRGQCGRLRRINIAFCAEPGHAGPGTPDSRPRASTRYTEGLQRDRPLPAGRPVPATYYTLTAIIPPACYHNPVLFRCPFLADRGSIILLIRFVCVRVCNVGISSLIAV